MKKFDTFPKICYTKIMKNRLHLDFALNTSEERTNFVTQYLAQPQFTAYPPTQNELETIANYILWGKNALGQNFVDEGLGELETRYKTWAPDAVESLDALLENPAFNENSLYETHTKKVRTPKFDRAEALRQCPNALRPQFEELFRQIDELELSLNYYELAHNKRTKPPRDELLAKFAPEDQLRLRDAAEQWGQYLYLKQKHYLVELRREQYTLRDSFVTTVQRNTPPTFNLPQTTNFGTEILVLPLGIDSPFFFRPLSQLNPQSYTPLELEQISDTYWSYREKEKKLPQLYFDFRKFEHVYQLFLQFFELEDDCAAADSFNNSQDLLKVLKYYVDFADLNEVYADILRQKMAHNSNIDIAIAINKKYGKTYSANYISTIFCKKIIPSINEAAENHQKIISNLFFEENFKQCTCCKTWLLRDSTNFIKKTRSPDGFNTRCKKCDKEIRNKKKNDKAGK